jgi:hypothetical protein
MRKLVLLAVLALAGCSKDAPQQQQPVAAPPQAVAPAAAPVATNTTPAPEVPGERKVSGETPALVTEPVQGPDRSTPATVLAALGRAIDAGDTVTLARLVSGSAFKPTLDQNDLLRAKLDFLGPAKTYWKKVLGAVDTGRLLALDASAATQTLTVETGGALGSVQINFVKEGNAWAVAL